MAPRLFALLKGDGDDGARAEDEPRDERPVSIAMLVVYDPTDKTVAKKLVDAIQPRLSLPVRTVSHAKDAEQKAKNADVALLLVSKKFENNMKLIKAVAKILPNSLVPIIIDKAMTNTKDWKGALAWYISDDLFINFCKPTKDAADWVMAEALAAKDRVEDVPWRRSFHVFLSHEWGKDNWVHKIAIKLASRLRRKHGIKVWLDAQQVSGSIHGSMADGIDSSTVFLVLATKGYMEKINKGDRSDNCLKEFQYAGNKRFDRIVVAALEEDMAKPGTGWTGRFQLALARQAPVDLSERSNGTFSSEAVERLANAIYMRIATPKASSNLTPLMRDIYPRLHPCSSEVWAKGKAIKFTIGTRSWIIDELCNWYISEKSAVFILVGDGGVGKSVIMAELCRRGGALRTDKKHRGYSHGPDLSHRKKTKLLPINVAAYHFFRHDQATTAAPKEALVSIAWQLCQSVPGFADALDSMNLGGIREKPLADVFQTILVDPLDRLVSKQMRQVVVLDALDECSKSDELLQKVIRPWKDAMPAWLSLVVSTRPEGEIQRGITNNSLDSKVLELKDEENFRDIENHIEHLLRDMKDTVEQEHVASRQNSFRAI
ncbi:Protein TANC1 [Hondaea fermentalgiana]|uniref:Protein TANC1 n=1 Tax=Hondaea fermentalgiana TaxID=2315210 RepID=A0A2R5GM00_9STRA|nr:Protein TANC1 [Hondaea fermentalgiana]|eukprot:GBG31922.1 Protein TANC1 [Hondaea fermentalgiana]